MGKIIVRLTLEELKNRLGMEGKNIDIESVFFRHDILSVDIVINGSYLPESNGELETIEIDDLIGTTQFKILTGRQYYIDKDGFGFPNPFYKSSRDHILKNFEHAKAIYKYVFNNFVDEWSKFDSELNGRYRRYIIRDEWRELII